MPRNFINYAKTLIFKIIVGDYEEYGSTTNLTNTKHNLKKSLGKSVLHQKIRENNYEYEFILMEEFPCENSSQVLIRIQELTKSNLPIPIDDNSKKICNHLKAIDVTNVEELLDYRQILKRIVEKSDSLSSQKTYLSACSSTVNGREGYEKAHKYYKKKLIKYAEEIKEQPRSDKQNENYMTKDEIITIHKSLKEQTLPFWKKRDWTDEQFNLFRDFVILSFYVLNSPRRSKDYFYMKVSKKPNEDYNWLMLKDKKFIFNKYKTFKTYGQQNIDICEELVEILSAYLKHHPLKKEKEFFLLIDNGEKISESFIKTTLTKLLGKNIGVSMFRNITLSSEFNFENVKKVEVQTMQKDDELSYYGKRIIVFKALAWDELYDRKIDTQLRNRLIEIFKKLGYNDIVEVTKNLHKTCIAMATSMDIALDVYIKPFTNGKLDNDGKCLGKHFEYAINIVSKEFPEKFKRSKN